MTDLPPDSKSNNDTGVGSTEDRPPGTPRWVKVFGIIVLVLVLLVAGLMIFGGGEHGPGRHTPSGVPGGHTPLIEYWVQQL
jgi:hypothetical protein